MRGVITVKILALLSAGSAILGAGTVVDDSTLVPVGIVVGAIVLATTLVWKVAGIVFSLRHELASMKRKLTRVMKRLNIEDDDEPPKPDAI